jgi:hypothetical protein
MLQLYLKGKSGLASADAAGAVPGGASTGFLNGGIRTKIGRCSYYQSFE